MLLFLVSLLYEMVNLHRVGCILYPLATETRQVQSLDGLWWFVAEERNSIGYGLLNKWFELDLSLFRNASRIAVPASYNDQVENDALRRHVGYVWYQKSFFVDADWEKQEKELLLRFGSVNYDAEVWINGVSVVHHIGGHLPFEVSIKKHVCFWKVNVVTVAVNNTLSYWTIPQAEFSYKNNSNLYPEGYFEQKMLFDFFNYAGIHRSVILYIVPCQHIRNIAIHTNFEGTTGFVNYSIDTKIGVANSANLLSVDVSVNSCIGDIVARGFNFRGILEVQDVILWWPRFMSSYAGYLYTLTVILRYNGSVTDIYRIPFGIRTVEVSGSKFLINQKPFYFFGFGMHEDSEIRGRGYDASVMVKDLNLLLWSHANSFRTSHYPYSEERMQEADRLGLVVVEEVPAVGLRELINFAKTLDTTRPVTIVYGQSEWATSEPNLIEKQLSYELKKWYETFSRPILMTEYGAEAIDGVSHEPPVMFSIQYQLGILEAHHSVFDELKEQFLIGEMVWNFADFMTDDSLTRVVGNRKGVFHRNRQPKSSAYLMQKRYKKLAENLFNVTDVILIDQQIIR
ncbi:Beta-glucuronidase [Trichinella pseudospiralis]|uniref:Beta-glucuronidase n=1 Tax=Trichinella pseudospiralis TaxID=6337 RepID=A0A0V1ITJ9_TRIPS|nr:Beta-glucuronidase [Trichinella pseudospiralis]KRZ16403.1 Beta-glucuronidase [Trichinella pseudospiralis]KRZ26059.1 Beta-glucuronidase [Trichinella pseudospiralis]